MDVVITETNWSGRGDSNSRSPAPKAGALATTLRPEAQGWSLNQISHSDYRPSTFSPCTRGCSSMVEPQPSKVTALRKAADYLRRSAASFSVIADAFAWKSQSRATSVPHLCPSPSSPHRSSSLRCSKSNLLQKRKGDESMKHNQFGNVRKLPSGRFQVRYQDLDGNPQTAKSSMVIILKLLHNHSRQ